MQSAIIMDFDRSDAAAIAVVLATILVSALCYAFILHAGIAIAE
ncbi:MAG TPA: hypothetical protein VM051_10075 [Usitatibacter sp.]|nr:hypothetical protein [Usitatibacter sp.]